VDYAEEMKITASNSLAIIVWVNNLQTPKTKAVLSSFFCDGNDIAGGSNRGGCLRGGGWA